METIIYARVSTLRQAQKEASIPEQVRACREYADRNGFVVPDEGIITDTDTGALILALPGMEQVRMLVRAGGVRRIIVLNQSRLARDELGYFTIKKELQRHRVEVHAVNRGGKIDGLYASLEAVLDADEKERIRIRTMNGRRLKVERGELPGHGPAPYGYIRIADKSGVLWHIDEGAAAVVRMIFTWYVQERLAVRAIADRLTEQGIPPPSVRRPEVHRKRSEPKWIPATVRWILRNPSYTGTFYAYRTEQPRGDEPGKRPPVRIRARSEWRGIPIPAIIDQATYDAAQRILDTAQQRAFRNTRYDYLMGRRIVCECGYSMTARTSTLTGYTQKRYPYYVCLARRAARDIAGPPCTRPIVRGDRVDAVVWQWVVDVLLTPDALRQAIAERDALPATELDQERMTLELERDAIRARIGRTNDAYVAGAMNLNEYATIKRGLDESLSRVDARLAALVSTPTLPTADDALATIDALADYTADVRDPDLPFAVRRAIIDRLEVTATAHWDGVTSCIAVASEALGIGDTLPLVVSD